MQLSIIVPAYNESRLLASTLAQLNACRAHVKSLGVETQLLVCDNNSTDNTAEIAAENGAEVVFESVNQISRARNAGAAAATGEWLLFVDADSHCPTALLADLAATMADPRVIGGGSVLKQDGTYFAYGMALRMWNAWSKFSKEAAGSFLFCRRGAFEEIGGFSGNLYAAEEIDFCRRLKKFGKTRNQHMRILSAHPLVTSSRKASLYKPREFFGFMMKTILQGGRTLKRREDCPIWYDGRR